MAKPRYPEDGFRLTLHTPLQAEYIRRIHESGIAAALDWLRDVKNDRECSLPQGILFRWEPEGETMHRLEISESPDFSDPWVWETRENSLFADNFKVDTRYHWRIDGSIPRTFCTDGALPRFIRLEGVLNVRDIGGNRIRQGMVYRGSAMDTPFQITDTGARAFGQQLQIHTQLDLRKDAAPGPSPIPGIHRVLIPYRPYWEAFQPEYMEALRQIFHLLALESTYPVYIHCMGGADRTGMIALYLRALLGESDEDIHLDYELTALSTYAAGAKEGADGFRSRYAPYYRAFLDRLQDYAPGKTLKEAVPAFLCHCGIPREQLDTIRKILRRK